EHTEALGALAHEDRTERAPAVAEPPARGKLVEPAAHLGDDGGAQLGDRLARPGRGVSVEVGAQAAQVRRGESVLDVSREVLARVQAAHRPAEPHHDLLELTPDGAQVRPELASGALAPRALVHRAGLG